MSLQDKKNKIKNLKISSEVHRLLKIYCTKHGLKMFALVEQLILDKCSKKKDIYGE